MNFVIPSISNIKNAPVNQHCSFHPLSAAVASRIPSYTAKECMKEINLITYRARYEMEKKGKKVAASPRKTTYSSMSPGMGSTGMSTELDFYGENMLDSSGTFDEQ